jgi:AAA ATPase domain
VLGAALRDADAGRGRLVTVTGEGGIGKTRVLEEFARRAAVPRDRLLWGRCPEQAGVPTYWPWIQTLRAYVEGADPEALREELGAAAAQVAQLLPAVRERVDNGLPAAGAAAVDPDAPEEARFALFDGITRFLERAGARAPLVLVIDDLHWADPASLALLDFVARALRGMRLLIVAAYRETRQAAPALVAVVRQGQRLALGGLALGDVARLVAARTAAAASEAVVGKLHRLTAGNPFFLDQLVTALQPGGNLTRADLRDGDVPLPESLRELLVQALDPLTPEERAVLEMAAVMGRDFDLAPLQAACELTPSALLDRLGPAMAAGLVERRDGVRPRFAHALIREALYRDILPAARAQAHRKIARAIEERATAHDELPAAELAHHFYHAAALGEGAAAVRYATLAAEQAIRLYAYEEGVAHYEHALAALNFEPPNAGRQLALLLALGDASERLGDRGRAAQAFRQAARVTRSFDDAEGFARAVLGLARIPRSGGVDATMVGLLEEALERLPAADGALRAGLLGCLATALYFSRETERREQLSTTAVAMAERLDDPSARAAALLARHLTLWGSAAPATRLALADEALRLATGAAQTGLMFASRARRFVNLLELGDIAAATAELEQFARQAEQARLPKRLWHATLMRTALALLAGRLDEGERLSREAAAVHAGEGDPNVAELATIQAFVLSRERGDAAPVVRRLEELAHAQPGMAAWQVAAAVLHAEASRGDQARSIVTPLATADFGALQRDGTFLFVLCLLTELAAMLGEPRWADPLYELLRPWAAQNVVVSIGAACIGSAERYLGLAAATLGRLDDAAAHCEAALAFNGRMGAQAQLAHTQADYALALRRRNGPDDARRAEALLGAAAHAAAALGMARLAARLAALETAPAPPGKVRTSTGGIANGELRRDGDHWTIAFGAESLRLKDTKGLVYLAALLRQPGREIHVTDLVTLAEPAGAALEERARWSVTRAVRTVLGKIATGCPTLGQHLSAAVRTGYFCVYDPDPRLSITWKL